jgi:hypothetical protein
VRVWSQERVRLAAALLVALAASACDRDVGIGLTISSTHAPLFGQVQVTIAGDLASLGEVNYFSVGGLQVVEPHWSDHAVTVTLQGAPRPGRADIFIQGSHGRTHQFDKLTFDPPVDAHTPVTWMAFGASFTMGTESSGVDPHTQRYGVVADVARAAGVYLGLPLVAPQTTSPLQPTDFYPDCTQIPGTGGGASSIAVVTADPVTGLLDLRRGRLDWTLEPRDVGVGGATVDDVVHGVHGSLALLAHIINDPTVDPGEILSPETVSQLDRVEAADPDIGLSSDLIGNDVIPAVLDGKGDLDASLVTPLAMVEPLLQQLAARLGKLHGHYFIANLPDPTFVPHVTQLRARRLAQGMDTAESFDAKVQQIQGLADAYNAALTAALAPYPNLHLVDFRGEVERIRHGTVVAGETLTVDAWGGLLSLDGLHLTDTGYALYAQVFVDRLNEVLGLHIPAVDVDGIHATDALAPARLRAAGYSCVPPLSPTGS